MAQAIPRTTIGPSRGVIARIRERHGLGAAIQFIAHWLVNRVLFFDWLHIIALERDSVRPFDSKLSRHVRSRFANRTDLLAMQATPELDIDDAKLELFDRGDECLLSYVDDRLAGYTWIHPQGEPELIPGLVISIPHDYLYNYSGLTVPEHRGLGLQPYRHHLVLDSNRWGVRRGLIGFVLHTNFASRAGQGKSGYRNIGSIWVVGSRNHFLAVFSRSLRRRAIRRIQ
jgi:hypothetical protein